MMEIQYIPLKSSDGRTLGHARVQGGAVDVHMRAGGGQACILTSEGHHTGAADTRMIASGQILAIAVHEDRILRCAGFAQGSNLAFSDVQRRITALTAPPPAAAKPAPLPQDAAPPEAAPADLPAPEPPARRSARHTPASDVTLHALEHLAQPEVAEFLPPEAPPSTDAPRIVAALPQQDEDGEEARAEAFAALLARAESVFARIGESFYDDEPLPPLPFTKAQTDAPDDPPIDAPASERAAPIPAADEWSRAVDSMLFTPPQSGGIPVENPFPHIFPGAELQHRGNLYGSETLMGEWRQGDETLRLTAVLGEYTPQPPETLPGFTRYIRTLRGGYWVRVEDGHFPFAKGK